MLRYRPKPKLACIYPNLLLRYLSCSSTLPLPFMGSLVSLGRAVPRQAHTGTDRHYTQHHKPWDSKKREKTLHRNHDYWTREAVEQGEQQGRDGPERGDSTAPPENRIRTEWSITRSYGQNRDNGCARSPASRPNSIRMQGTSPTVHKNGPEERRAAADTAWNDAAKERCKTDPRFTLARQEEKI